MWDYNVGLVRMTPFFKCCKYSKVRWFLDLTSSTEKIATKLNDADYDVDPTSQDVEHEPRPSRYHPQHHRRLHHGPR